MLDQEGFKFDLVTQRFIINRWETDTGKLVRDKVIYGLKNSVEVRAILDNYVLEHPDNIDPYGHPYYPKDAMSSNSFWVLTSDDLRGIRFYSENFEGSPSFEKKSLGYSRFFDCDLRKVDLELTDLSYAVFDKCKLDEVVLAGSGGFSTIMSNCSARNICFLELWL